MKLSEEVLAEGRAQVEAKDMAGFKVWCEKHAYSVSWSEVERSYAPLFKHDHMDMALRLFDKFFPELDNAKHVRKGLMRLGCVVFLALGALGGVVYLVQAIF